MASFSIDRNSLMSCIVETFVDGFHQRGGSNVVEVSGKIVIFGGVDRDQTHFQDTVVFDSNSPSSKFHLQPISGNIPTPRSGHGMVSYGKYMLLFGGIDFGEEACYNDLYLLDTDTWEWHYVGESGVEVPARNSHSLSILEDEGSAVLLIYGGASAELGPLGDLIYCILPPINEIDLNSFYVSWQQQQQQSSAPSPREMHSSLVIDKNCLLISGGRDLMGQMLNETWILIYSKSNVDEPLTWQQLAAINLPKAMCSHAAFLTPIKGNDHDSLNNELQLSVNYCIYGGFSLDGLVSCAYSLPLQIITSATATKRIVVITEDSHSPHTASSSSSRSSSGNCWATRPVHSSLQSGRFGHCMAQLSERMVNCLQEVYHNRSSSAATADSQSEESVENSIGGGLLIGGVDPIKDYGDIWLIL